MDSISGDNSGSRNLIPDRRRRELSFSGSSTWRTRACRYSAKKAFVVLLIATFMITTYIMLCTHRTAPLLTDIKSYTDMTISSTYHRANTTHIMPKSTANKTTPSAPIYVMDFIKPARCLPQVRLAVVVCVKWDDIERRKAIRESWGLWSRGQVKVVFAFGVPVNRSELVGLTQNEGGHDDMVYTTSFIDTYQNLTLKTLAALEWTRRYCTSARWLYKADADVFLNIPMVLRLAESMTEKQKGVPFIAGNVQYNAPVVRNPDSKWYVAKEDYSADIYPNYVTGPGYLVSIEAVQWLHNYGAGILTAGEALFVWEDVCVTGLWRQSLGIALVHTNDIRFLRLSRGEEGVCTVLNLAMLHRISGREMREIWTQIQSKKGEKCG